jgi:hypothetical protein
VAAEAGIRRSDPRTDDRPRRPSQNGRPVSVWHALCQRVIAFLNDSRIRLVRIRQPYIR